MPPSSSAVVQLPADLHARPAGVFCKAAAAFESVITISFGDKAVDARSVLMVMSLGATKGSAVTVSALGTDADGAVQQLARILAGS
jgi:phosphocarrier protein HPr